MPHNSVDWSELVTAAQCGGAAGVAALKQLIDLALSENSFTGRRIRQILETKFRIKIMGSFAAAALIGTGAIA